MFVCRKQKTVEDGVKQNLQSNAFTHSTDNTVTKDLVAKTRDGLVVLRIMKQRNKNIYRHLVSHQHP